MDDSIYIWIPELAFVGAVMLLLPHFSPRGYFFGITVPEEFRATEAARTALHRYYWRVAVSIGVAALAVIYLARQLPALAAAAVPLLPFASGMYAFLLERRRVRVAVKAAPAAPLAHPGGAHLPPWLAWALVPFAFPLATALYLRGQWDRIPERFPIHWGANGQPNGWVHRTAGGVYGPLLFAAGLMLLMLLLLSLAMSYGSRQAPQMLAVLKILIGVTYFLGLLLSGVSLLPVLHISPMIFVAATPIFVIALLVYSMKYIAGPAMPAESTPDECWNLGSIYYNPRDPALFVQKRIGVGYTLNFGQRLSWVILGGFLAGIAGLAVFLIGALR